MIEEGLQPGEWVLVSGLQLVRPRLEVKPERTAMVGNQERGAAGDAEGGTRRADSGRETEKLDEPARPSLPKSTEPSQQEQPATDRPATTDPSRRS